MTPGAWGACARSRGRIGGQGIIARISDLNLIQRGLA
jgi:hypothetical protein